MEESSGRPPLGGVARRRRERRLRSMLRHEQQSIRMALATVMHHSFKVHSEYGAPRSQTAATRAREEEVRELHYGLRAQERPLPGTRPAPLLEVLPQVWAQWHTVDQIVDAVPGLPALDAPVPLMVEQQAEVLQFFDALIPVAEQVIDVPKIFIERIPPRTSVREPQLAEQLVEVPMIVSFSSLQRIMEQTVDIPVPHGGGRHADLQGFLRGQNSTGVGKIVDIPGGGLHRPGQSSSSADGLGEGFFFALFPMLKKCDSTSALGVGTAQLDAARVSAGVPSLAPAVLASADETVDASVKAFHFEHACFSRSFPVPS